VPGKVHPHRLDVGIDVPAVSAEGIGRVAVGPFVEEALAGEIVVDPEDVGRGVPLPEQGELGFADAVVEENAIPGMLAVDVAAQRSRLSQRRSSRASPGSAAPAC
jgi:hypothetical protein